ncbi:putative L,D-transpeptidase ErfK/SrfK precursor [Paracoccus haematequi]|uniref:Putative L,D-transpeptidase ErfK/SrfK n=1 Tax=Paracoccus haematequi TaxID=2491866 RepID=A0A447ITL2_9RHOB|nr:L,D-transpeptidase [Paracoccus haematequi]VDS10856.1 putative L,D-transpeptidase ErfK/SrfK precursor [Paracoccus haematequi]
MIPKDTGSDRRRFLGGLLATAAVLPGGALLAQGSDPNTGQPLYGARPSGGAPDLSAYQVDPTADPRRNQSSFRARHWSEFYPSLGKGVILADVTSRAVHYWSGDESINLAFPCSIPVTEDRTRRGKTEIVRKAKNPPWTPTPSMREKDPNLPQRVEGGDPSNPLGPYGLYLSWPAYLIHGTHDTRKIGRKSSNGCYGLYNEHITRLYEVAEVGTQVTVF